MTGTQPISTSGRLTVHGVEKLKGAPVMATDLRASVSLILAGLLASTGVAMAQGTDAAPAALKPATSASAGQNVRPHHGEHRMGNHDGAKMQDRMAKRQAELKAKLKITPAQEGAWSTFTAAMQPPAPMMRGERPHPAWPGRAGRL